MSGSDSAINGSIQPTHPIHLVAVIDFGSQYTQLIIRRIREIGYYALLYQPADLGKLDKPAAIILSGGPKSTTEEGAPDFDMDTLLGYQVPVLGVCYGMQLSNIKWGGEVSASTTKEYGPARLIPTDHGKLSLFKNFPQDSQIWMSHSDTVSKLPDQAEVLAYNSEETPVALQWAPDYFGIQFHPEVTHTDEGQALLENFLSYAPLAQPYSIDSLKQELLADIKSTVGDREVVCGVSGGVDSTVLAVLLKEAGVKMKAVFVDHGLLRQGEAEEVVENFNKLGVPIEKVEVSELFLGKLEGESDPEAKRKIIGDLFVDVFFEAAGEIEVLAQGTLYPDVIESASSGSIASKIKTHHNRVDRILELAKEGKVLEPLAELFKDEVRSLGRGLGIPDELIDRHPFPGPGLAVRCPGIITDDRLRIIREADAIFMRQLKESGWYNKTWQAYACLIPVKTVGVKGDERSYEFAISLRAVVSLDAMTADWVELPPQLLRDTSNEILNSVAGVNRVLYDISTKPPASIEWE